MLYGIDVSHWQGNINWSQVKANGTAFSAAKITEGTGTIDRYGTANRSGAKGVGMVSGGYHFARGGDWAAEADAFISAMGIMHGEFAMLDWEIEAPDPAQWSLNWLKRVETRANVRPFIYMDEDRLHRINWAPVIANGNPLWLAKYDGSTKPIDTGPWPLIVKQYTNAGTVGGIMGNVDRDIFYGEITDLLTHCQGGSLPPVQNPWDTLPTLTYGMVGSKPVQSLQQFLHDNYPAYRHSCGELTPIAGNYKTITRCWVAQFQARSGITGSDANGTIVGPRTKQALWSAGWRG